MLLRFRLSKAVKPVRYGVNSTHDQLSEAHYYHSGGDHAQAAHLLDHASKRTALPYAQKMMTLAAKHIRTGAHKKAQGVMEHLSSYLQKQPGWKPAGAV